MRGEALSAKPEAFVMRRIVMMFTMLGVIACDQSAAPVSGPRPPAKPLFDSPADGTQMNQTIDISGVVVSPCTGEAIAYQGSSHVVASVTTTADGFTVSYHFNTQNITGVGVTTGTQYQISDTFKEVENTVTAPLGESAQASEEYRVVSQGSSDNFLVHAIYTFTFPPFNVTYKVNDTQCTG